MLVLHGRPSRLPGWVLVLRNSVENLVSTRVPIQSLRAAGGMQDFTGVHCHISTEAVAFLFYGDSVKNLVSTRVLMQSLRAAGGMQDFTEAFSFLY